MKVWDKYSDVFMEFGIQRPDYTVTIFDDCDTGYRYRYIVDTIVYDYYTNEIKLKWCKEDIMLLCIFIDMELTCLYDVVDDNYKPILHYNGIHYTEVSKPLIRNLFTSTVYNAQYILNIPIGLPRSQILLFKSAPDSDDSSWFDDYITIKYDYLLR